MVWANSRFEREVYARSGVPAEKISLVPHGVRTDVFTPEGPQYPLPLHPKTQKRPFRFLYVGGTVDRKGPDLLLEAYLRAFTAEDNVCLVIKDACAKTFYRDQNLGQMFRDMEADATAPHIVYLDEDLTEEELASLYRACDCVVLAYRGEGFGLSPLEGMACGLPVIVTGGGPTDDYMDKTMGIRLPSRKIPRVPVGTVVGPDSGPWEFEPDMDALVAALRQMRDNPEQARAMGARAREHVVSGWDWNRSVELLCERLEMRVAPKPQGPSAPATLWSEPAPRADRTPPEEIEITVCIIARQEAKRIRPCLESIAPLCRMRSSSWIPGPPIETLGDRSRLRRSCLRLSLEQQFCRCPQSESDVGPWQVDFLDGCR